MPFNTGTVEHTQRAAGSEVRLLISGGLRAKLKEHSLQTRAHEVMTRNGNEKSEEEKSGQNCMIVSDTMVSGGRTGVAGCVARDSAGPIMNGRYRMRAGINFWEEWSV